MRKYFFSVLLIGSGISGAACGGSTLPTGGTAVRASTTPAGADAAATLQAISGMPEVVVGKQDNGKIIELDEAHVLKISLPCHGAIGKVWVMRGPNPRHVRRLYEAFVSNTGRIGAPGTQILYFGGVSVGEETLELQYGRPNEAEDVFQLRMSAACFPVKGHRAERRAKRGLRGA